MFIFILTKFIICSFVFINLTFVFYRPDQIVYEIIDIYLSLFFRQRHSNQNRIICQQEILNPDCKGARYLIACEIKMLPNS